MVLLRIGTYLNRSSKGDQDTSGWVALVVIVLIVIALLYMYKGNNKKRKSKSETNKKIKEYLKNRNERPPR